MAPNKYHIKWTYGKEPNPRTWHETVEALASLQATRAREKKPEISPYIDNSRRQLHSFNDQGKKGFK